MDCLSLTIATREIARLVDDLPVPLYTPNSNSFSDLCSCSPVQALIATRPDGQKSWISPRIKGGDQKPKWKNWEFTEIWKI